MHREGSPYREYLWVLGILSMWKKDPGGPRLIFAGVARTSDMQPNSGPPRRLSVCLARNIAANEDGTGHTPEPHRYTPTLARIRVNLTYPQATSLQESVKLHRLELVLQEIAVPWSEELQCDVERADFEFEARTLHLYLARGQKVDMAVAVAFAKHTMANVRMIDVYTARELDMIYFRDPDPRRGWACGRIADLMATDFEEVEE